MFINFLETFFFLSLGIAFVLILLIVYHFKQQIAAIEQKSDTLFDIIQNLAKEITSLKSQQHFAPSNMPMFFSSNGENLGNVPIRMFDPSAVEEFKENEEIEFYDDDEDVDDDDEEEEEEDEEEDKGSDTDDESILYTGEEYGGEYDEEQVYKKIKVNDDILEGEQVTNLEEIPEELVPEELVPEEDLQDESQIHELELNMDYNIDTNNQDVDEDNRETPSVNTESYKRMNLTTLKSLALSKGIQVDMSKMKKNDLIKLLQ